MSVVDREALRQALEKYDGHVAKTAYATAEDMAVLAEAARVYADLLDNGPDYEAAEQVFVQWLGWGAGRGIVAVSEPLAGRTPTRRIVDAALAAVVDTPKDVK